MGGSGGFREGLRGKWAERNDCELKRRGCCPDTATADGKADRNFTRFSEFYTKGLQLQPFLNLGVVSAENSVDKAFFKELMRVK